MFHSQKMPEADGRRIDFITMVYAAAVGIGYSYVKYDTINPTSISQWIEVIFIVGTMGIVAADYAFVREMYLAEGAYSKLDFFLDIFIAFCFTRMLDNAGELYEHGIPKSFRWWGWLGTVFFAYTLWDAIRWMKGTTQLLTLIADSTTGFVALGYCFLPKWYPNLHWLHLGIFPAVMGVISLCLYMLCVYVWRREILGDIVIRPRN